MERTATRKPISTLTQSMRGSIGDEDGDFACVGRGGGGGGGRKGGTPFKMKEVV